MAPDGLKVGDTYIEDGVKHIVTKVCTHGPARYEAKVYEGPEKAEIKAEEEKVEEVTTEVEKTEEKPKRTRKTTKK